MGFHVGSLLLVSGLGFLCYNLLQQIISNASVYEDRYLAAADKQLDALFYFIEPDTLLRISALSGLFFGLAVAFVAISAGMLVSLLLGVVVGVLGFWLPRWLVQALVMLRRRKLVEQLPDALGVIVSALKAGRALPQAMEMVVDEMPKPVSQEFGLLLREREHGESLASCADRLVMRVPLTDIKLFALILRLSTRMGGDITEPLQNVAETIRNRFMIEKKIKSITSEIRFQSIMIALMPFLVFLALSSIAPEMMAPVKGTKVGLAMLLVVLTLELLAGAVMWKLTKIKY